jgi:hypothetical protein
MRIVVILGPVPCQGCRKPVVYGYPKSTGLNRTWRNPTGKVHRCA